MNDEVQVQADIEEGSEGLALLRQRVVTILDRQPRAMIGVCGPPGAGKSFVAEQLTQSLGQECVVVPMDGFHLSNAVLSDLGTISRKGAIFTFDGWGFESLLGRIRARREDIVYAPAYVRGLEEPIAATIPVQRGVPVVIVEGNYLLADEEPWTRIKDLLDEVWYLDISDQTRLERLIARHRQFGRTEEDARRHAYESDELNAQLIEQTRNRADVVIRRAAD